MVFLVAMMGLLSQDSCSVDWTPAERQGIETALHAMNMTPEDLRYNKRPFNDKYRLPIVDRCLDDPLAVPVEVEILRSHLFQRFERLPSVLMSPLFSDYHQTIPAMVGGFQNNSNLRQLPKALHEPARRLIESVEYVNARLSKVFRPLNESERRDLINSLPQIALEEETKIQFDFQKPNAKRLKPDSVWKLLDKIDMRELANVADLLSWQSHELASDFSHARRMISNWRGKVSINTAYGRIVIAGTGDDVHDYGRDVIAIIELGGNDTYRGATGGAIGNATMIIDLAGNDNYDLGDLSGGAGLLGIGLLYDVAGDDTFRGGHLCFGAGLAGVGMLIDRAGNDVYTGKTMTQGFAMFGLGWLDDWAGNDLHDAWFMAQGAAATMGIGILSDHRGNDIYRAGGWLLNAPLLEKEKVHYSFAQGFATGFREDTGGKSGGIGFLYDGAGDDTYSAESYAQGASYWFSFGALLDMGGHDSYDSYYYSQASAMHLTVAALMDMGGDDSYSCKKGAMHAIGHDYGVAVMLDRAGNDAYTGANTKPGVGNANGVGIFVDSAGDDGYNGPPAVGNPARGSGSVGIFVDLGGADRYYPGFADGQVAVKDQWAVALDMPDPLKTETTTQATETPKPPIVGSIPAPNEKDMEQIYKDASLWEVGGAREKVRAARHKLIGIGLPACKYLAYKKLKTVDNLSMRTFVEVFGAVGPEAQLLLVKHLNDSDENQTKNLLRMVQEIKITSAADYLVPLIYNPKFIKQALRVAGALKAKDLVPELIIPAISPDETIALEAVIALGQIGDPRAAEVLADALSEDSMPVREAAAVSLVQLGPIVIPLLNAYLASDIERDKRMALKVLRQLKVADAESYAVRFLDDKDWGVRLDAIETLVAIGKSDIALTHRERETNPLLLARLDAIAAKNN